MLKNYLKIAWRNLLKHKTFSLINILGLAIGIAACMIIFVYVQHELTFDQYNKKANRIARITVTMHAPESDIVLATTSTPLAGVLLRNYPGVESATRFENSPQVIKSSNELFKENDFYKAEQSVFTVFDFKFLEGSATDALTQPNTIVITETIAKKYFGNKSAVGKIINCNEKDLLVTAVVQDRPSNSDLKIDALLFNDFSKSTLWVDDFDTYTFVLFKSKPNLKSFGNKLDALSKKYVQPELNASGAEKYSVQFEPEPLADVHFSKGKVNDSPKGSRQYNYVFSILAVFILLIALLNYINLSTAKATERAKEVGIRKVSGARPFQLIRQFLFESFLLIAIAWVASIALVFISLPFLNKLLQTTLSVNWSYGIVFTGIIFLITLFLAGLYPAFVLSAFKPVKVLKGNWRNNATGLLLRKTITVIQFTIAAALIMGTTVIYHQLHFIEKKDLGFNKDHLFNIFLPRDSAYVSSVKAFQNELRTKPEVENMTVGGGLLIDGLTWGTTILESEGKKREIMCNFFPVDPNFLPVFKIQLLEGRNLSDSFGTDKQEGFLVNEAFVKMMGWKSALGKPIEGWSHKGKIIGVVKNFYYRSLHNLIEPLVMVYNIFPINTTTIRIKPADIAIVKQVYKRYFPGIPMDYSFLDETISKQYKKDRITMSLFNDFTLLAIFVSCLGLYGLVALIAVQRSKEVSIRKVLGASVIQLLSLLAKYFIKLVLIALVIALPLAGILMNNWLSSYAYHVQISWWMFLIPVATVLLITLIVVSRELLKTTLANPVKALRAE